MHPRLLISLKLGAALTLVALGLGFAIVRWIHLRRTGEEGAKVWFYEQDSRSLYAAPRETLPPDDKHGAGVRAVVVTFRGEEQEPGKRRIAYLQTYGPALKQLLLRLQTAQAEGRPLSEHPPPRESEFFRTNDLVKRLGDPQWHACGSPEGQKIMAEWRSWRGPSGQAPVVCLPR